MPENISEAMLTTIVERIVDAVSPRMVYLFGSRLYGTPHEDSDIDLLIMVSDDVEPSSDYYKRVYAALRGIDAIVEPHFCTLRDFNRFGQVVGSLQKEVKDRGRLLYAA